MADRSIVVRLRAEVNGFKQAFGEATKATEQTAKATEDAAKRADSSMGRMVQSAEKNRGAWDTAGATLSGFGAAAVGGLALATKAAMDWESSWAGVAKTVDGTPEQMTALESSLRGLARELPASHQEIAAVAEAAGQLGVAREDIVSFTTTMINLGEATNLSADDAATSIAQFTNVMGTSAEDVDNLASSLVALGNDGASTEADIMNMAQRLSGAGALIGSSEQDIMGLSSALSSVGITAEAGGSALSRVLQKMNTDVLEGGDGLEQFAEVAGVSAEEFAAKWRSSPVEAFDLFSQGLNRVKEEGGNAVGVLGELGIKSTEETRAILSLAGAGDLLSDSLATANSSWDENSALAEEVSRRYETAESRIQLAKNALVDAGISIGATVLPAFASLADGVADVAGWFADLPAPVQGTVAGLAGVTGAAGLAAGAFLLVFPRVMDTVQAFKQLNSDGLTSIAGKIGKVTLAVGALAAVPPVLNAVSDGLRGIDSASFDLGMNELTSGLLEAEKSGQVFENTMGDLYDSGALNKQMFEDLGSSVTEVANINWFQNLIGPLAASGIDDAKNRLTDLGDTFTMLAQTDMGAATGTFKAFMDEVEAGGGTFDEVMKVMPSFREHLAGVANELGMDGTDNAVLYRIAIGEIAPAADEASAAAAGMTDALDEAAAASEEAAAATDELIDALVQQGSAFLDSRESARQYAEAAGEAMTAAAENGKAWEDGTDKALENADAIDTLAQATLDNVESMRGAGEPVAGFMQEARDEIIKTAESMGASKEEAEAYADSLGLAPDDITTVVNLETEEAQAKWDTLWGDSGFRPPEVEVPVTVDTNPAVEGVQNFQGALSMEPPTDLSVGANTEPAEGEVQGFVGVLGGTQGDVSVGADTSMAQSDLYGALTEIENSGGTITIDGNPVTAEQALSQILSKTDGSTGTMGIDGNTSGALGALNGAVTIVNNSDGTITIKGNNSDAKSSADSAKGYADGKTGTIDVDGNNAGAKRSADSAASYADGKSASISVTANTSSARSAIQDLTRTRYVSIVARAVGPSSTGRRVAGFATGGPVYGAGTGTSDSIPAVLSNGEHVFTAREVAAAGGHDAMFRLRASIMDGLRFANGGGVEKGGYAAAPMSFTPAVRTSSASATVDTGAIASAVNSAMSSWQPVVNIGGRQFAGLMLEGQRAIRTAGGR